MQKFLLDTHSLLWFLSGEDQLSNKARKLIQHCTNSTLIDGLLTKKQIHAIFYS